MGAGLGERERATKFETRSSAEDGDEDDGRVTVWGGGNGGFGASWVDWDLGGGMIANEGSN